MIQLVYSALKIPLNVFLVQVGIEGLLHYVIAISGIMMFQGKMIVKVYINTTIFRMFTLMCNLQR